MCVFFVSKELLLVKSEVLSFYLASVFCPDSCIGSLEKNLLFT